MRARMTQIQENIRDSGTFGLAKSNKRLLAIEQWRAFNSQRKSENKKWRHVSPGNIWPVGVYHMHREARWMPWFCLGPIVTITTILYLEGF